MKSWSLRVGKFFGIDVFIHWTFWILIGWIFLMHLGMEDGAKQAVWGVLFILALFGCVVLHEFGHALTARRFGVVTKDITLYPIGGISRFESLPEKPGQELLVGIAGPAVNLLISLILWICLRVAGQEIPDFGAIGSSHNMFQMPFLWSLFLANLVLAVFNLIPAFPMDGGRVLRSFLSLFMDRLYATTIAARLGQLLAISFVFFGFFYNFWMVFIGLFIYLGAGGEAAFEQAKSALAGLTVKDALMRRFTVLKPETTLKQAVDALLNSQETEFVVVNEDKPVGLLTRTEIIVGLSKHGENAPVSQCMITDFLVVNAEMKLADFFQLVLEKGQTVALVMSDNSFQGLIDKDNVEEKMLVQQALRGA